MSNSKVTEKHIEDTFNRLWFVVEEFLDTIRDPSENEFATKQLEKFRDSVNALAFKRIHSPLEAELWEPDYAGSDLQTFDQHQIRTPVTARFLPAPSIDNSTPQDIESGILMSQLRTMNENLTRNQDVEAPSANLIPSRLHTSFPVIVTKTRSACGPAMSKSLNFGTAPRKNKNKVRQKLKDLTFSMMSSDYLTQLRTNILALTTNTSLRASCEVKDVATIFHTLERTQLTQSFTSRVLLFRLVSIRDKIIQDLKLKRKSGITPKRGTRTVEAQAIDILVKKIHKHIRCDTRSNQVSRWRQEFVHERTGIQNKLHSARIWKILIKEFGLAILILIPWSGQYGSLNSRYQSSKDAKIKELCGALRRQDNGLIQEASNKLNPFIEAILEGSQPFRLQIEREDTILTNISRSTIIDLLGESDDA